MPPELLVEEQDGYRYAALVSAGRLIDLAVDRLGEPYLYQSIWRGQIDRIVPNVGAFANYGTRTGLFRNNSYKSGDTVIAQVKSRRAEGKADILTEDISLGGRFFVYLPRGTEIAVSKKIKAQDAAPVIEALHAAGITGGILRSGALQGAVERVVTEAVHLRERWREAEKQPLPMLLQGPDATQRLAHDYPQYNLKVPLPVGEAERLSAQRLDFPVRGSPLGNSPSPVFLSRSAKENASPTGRGFSSSSAMDLPEQISALLQSEIKLPKGGSVIIERTAALTAIDVNAGTRRPVEVDREALEVIAMQIRLRNLSGLIVIDFTSPTTKQSTPALLQSVRRALADDPAGCRVLGVTPSGLVELTRPARDLPLLEKLGRTGHDATEG